MKDRILIADDTALRTAYLKNLDPADMKGLQITVSTGRHPRMLSVAGLIGDLWAEYCDREPRAGAWSL